MKKLFTIAAAILALMGPTIAFAQQAVPGALDVGGRPLQVTPTSPIIAPAGGGAGIGRPVAEDKGMPVQGRDTVSGLPCAIGPTSTCQFPGSGGGGSFTATASAAPTPVVAGTGKPFNIDLFSAGFVTVTDGAGGILDWSAPVPVTQSGSWTNIVQGAVASGSALTGNPLPNGCLAKTSLPTAVPDAAAVYGLCDKYGRQISPSIMRENKGIQRTAISGTGETTIVTADASNKLELYCLVMANTNTSNAATADIKDSTSGTTRGTFQIPAGDTRGFCVGADSGWPQAAINTNWTATLTGTSPTVTFTASYLKAGS